MLPESLLILKDFYGYILQVLPGHPPVQLPATHDPYQGLFFLPIRLH